MLQVISPLKGFAVEASDGRIGTVVDYLFDDASWKVRWLVIDCGTWLSGRKVLIHPSAIARERPRAATIRCCADKGPGRGQPGIGRGSAGLAANGESALHLLRLGPALGRPQSLRDPWRNGFALDGAALFGPGSNRRGRGSRRRFDFAGSRSASAQRRRSHRIPCSCGRRRNRPYRKSHDRRRQLEHPLFHRRHPELVVWKACADFAASR